MFEYVVSGVARGMREEESIRAKSEKQAWFLFAKKYKFHVRDFKVLRATNLEEDKKEDRNIQLSFLDVL